MATALRKTLLSRLSSSRSALPRFFSAKPSRMNNGPPAAAEPECEEEIPMPDRPVSEILKELSKKVPESFVKVRREDNYDIKYVPWHIINRILNLHAPEWSGEVRSITYSPDGKTVTVVYRVTLYGTDAEVYREASGTASVDDTNYGGPVQKAEAMAFRRACARLGLGLHLYHEDAL